MDMRRFEGSDLNENVTEARPSELLCACCMRGGAENVCENKEKVRALLDKIEKEPDIHIVLRSAFDDAGARTELYDLTTPLQRKRDLDIFRAMGAIPGSVRTARIWSQLLKEYIPDVSSLCAPFEREDSNWRNCPNASCGHFKEGLSSLCPERDKAEKACVKESSVCALYDSDALSVRAHHLMCMICFLGGSHPEKPLVEDNLYELWQKILSDPSIPVTLIEGPGDCVVCPPCHAFDKKSRLCNASCSLKDRKKDLDAFSRIGLVPGDTLPAIEILRRIYDNIKTVDGICRFEERRGYDWRNCRPFEDMSYVKGLETVASALSFK